MPEKIQSNIHVYFYTQEYVNDYEVLLEYIPIPERSGRYTSIAQRFIGNLRKTQSRLPSVLQARDGFAMHPQMIWTLGPLIIQ
jgi:hypothetical protein